MSNTTIGFDGLSPGGTVTTQYQPQGVVLGSSSSLGAAFSPGDGDCGGPVVTANAGAFSAPNDAQPAVCASPASSPRYYSGTFGKLTDYPRGAMSVQVRLVSGPASGVTMIGYDTAGNVVATGTVTPLSTGWTLLSAPQSSGSPLPAQISYFEIRTTLSTATDPARAPIIAIDDLSFDQAGAPLNAAGVSIAAQAGSAFSGPVATLTDGDPTATTGDFGASIDWGDSASSVGSVSAGVSPGTFTISGAHTWAAPGTRAVHVTITKFNGRTAAANSTATVTGGGGGGSPPSAAIQLTTPNQIAGGLIGFSGAGSHAGTGRIISYDWGFDSPGTTTSTGSNPNVRWIFKPGPHTITLTVTDSGGQKSTTHFGVTVGASIKPFVPDGGQGDCQPSYDSGNVHIVADCIQTLGGGGFVMEGTAIKLNGMVLATKDGGNGIFKIQPFTELGVGSGTSLTGPSVNVELLNTPIGNVVLGGRDLTNDPIHLAFQAFHPPTVLHFGSRARPIATVADDNNKTLLMSLGVGKACTAGVKDPTCCPPESGTTACATLPGGFPITGQINVYLNNKGQALFDVQVGLDLSAVNFEATGALEIVADPVNGINLNSLQFTIPQAGLANLFQVKNASFVYYFPSDPDASKRDTWQAKATIIFGPLSQPSLAGELDFQQGQFHKASMLFTAPSGTGVPIYPGILVNQIGGTVGVNPLEFGGQLGASIATQLELSLAFLYSEPTDTQLGFFGGQGQLSYQGDNIATLAADVYSDGYTDAKLDLDLHFPFGSDSPVVSATGHIGFWDEPSSGRWEADGSIGLKLWVISAEVAGLVNDKYIAGCADVAGFGVQGRYAFADGGIAGGFFGFSNCDDQLKPYKETPVTPHTGGFVGSARFAGQHGSARVTEATGVTAADTNGGGTVRLPGGTDGQELLISSTSGTPVVSIYAPNHQVYTTPAAPGKIATSGGAFISAIAPNSHQVLVFLRHPQAGVYNIQPTASSAPISTVAAAQDVPPARVRVSVDHRHGRRWALRYTVRNLVAGTSLQFVERGRDSTHVIATVKRASGTVTFVPQDAIGRHRRIVAYLRSATGAPLRTVTVGSYQAPAAIRAGRIARVRFARRGTAATLTWTPAAAARRYRVLVRGSDGRVVSAITPASRRRVTLAQALPTERFTARVTAQGGPNLLTGPTARARLSAASTGLVELLSCHRAVCTARVVSGTLVLGGHEIGARLGRGATTTATGIASDREPRRVALAVRHRLALGRYTLTLSYRGRAVRRAITIR